MVSMASSLSPQQRRSSYTEESRKLLIEMLLKGQAPLEAILG